MLLLIGMIALTTLVSCEKDKDNKELDGTWNNGYYSIIVKGSDYTSKVYGNNYGKGKVTYNVAEGTFNFTSTHAWDSGSWDSFVEICNGTMTLNKGIMTILTVDNRSYRDWMIGTWTRE